LLGYRNHQVVEAGDGAEGLERARYPARPDHHRRPDAHDGWIRVHPAAPRGARPGSDPGHLLLSTNI
jgi:hypothetical protein